MTIDSVFVKRERIGSSEKRRCVVAAGPLIWPARASTTRRGLTELVDGLRDMNRPPAVGIRDIEPFPEHPDL